MLNVDVKRDSRRLLEGQERIEQHKRRDLQKRLDEDMLAARLFQDDLDRRKVE